LSQQGANRADVRRENTSSRIYGIMNVYGDCVIRDLIEIDVSDDDTVDEKCSGWMVPSQMLAMWQRRWT
jgi:hypothetical protein